jgi:hypothetical protein
MPPDIATSPTSGWIPEAELAIRFGIPRQKLKKERSSAGPNAFLDHNRVLHWSQEAAAALALRLGLAFQEKNEPDAQSTDEDATELLTVASQPAPSGFHFGNPRLIRAMRECGTLVIVRVHDSSKYMTRLHTGKPMTFKARRSPAGAWWVIVGREPRYPGRW